MSPLLARVAVFVCALSGCALMSKGEPLRPRYFDPELARAAAAVPPDATGVKLRLGRIDSSSYLREPITFHDSDEELGYYETRRWTEKPERYVRRAFERALFEEHGFVRAMSGDVPTLEAELIDFSEDRVRKLARLRLRVILHDEHTSLFEQTLELAQPIAPAPGKEDTASEVVRALAQVLHEAVERVSTEVAQKLEARSHSPDAEAQASASPEE